MAAPLLNQVRKGDSCTAPNDAPTGSAQTEGREGTVVQPVLILNFGPVVAQRTNRAICTVMKRKYLILHLAVLWFFAGSLNAQTWSGILSPGRAINWSS